MPKITWMIRCPRCDAGQMWVTFIVTEGDPVGLVGFRCIECGHSWEDSIPEATPDRGVG